MGMWSSIYRIRRLSEGKLTIKRDGEDITIKAPVEVREEFLIGKNNWPIHYWFARYAEREWGIPFGSPAFEKHSAEPVNIFFSDLEKLSNQLALSLENPLLRGKFFFIPDFDKGVYMEQWYVDCLKQAQCVVDKLVEEDKTTEYEGDFAYDAG